MALFDGKRKVEDVKEVKRLADEVQSAYSQRLNPDERVVLLIQTENGRQRWRERWAIKVCYKLSKKFRLLWRVVGGKVPPGRNLRTLEI
jgi:hypothetical protein